MRALSTRGRKRAGGRRENRRTSGGGGSEDAYRFLSSAVEGVLAAETVLSERSPDLAETVAQRGELRQTTEMVVSGLDRLADVCRTIDAFAYEPRVIAPDELARARRRARGFLTWLQGLEEAGAERPDPEGFCAVEAELRAAWGA